MSNKCLGNSVLRYLNYFFSEFQHNNLPKKIAYSFRVVSVTGTSGNKSLLQFTCIYLTAFPKIF